MQAELLHARLLDGKGGARTLDAKGVADWQPEQGVLWVHFDIENPATRAWLLNAGGFDAHDADTLTAVETRPRAHMDANGSLVVLRGVNTNPGEDPEDMVAIRMYLEPNRIVSTRRRKLLSVLDIVAALDEGRGPKGTGDLLVKLVGRLADRIGNFVDLIEDRIGEVEDREGDDDLAAVRRAISDIRRQLASVRRFIAPQRDALERLYREDVSLFDDASRHALRDEIDRTTRYLEDIDLARERVVVLQEEFISQQAQEQNTRMYVLSVVAAVFLPLTFVTGLLGMNVGGLPGLDNPLGFYISVIVMVAAAFGLLCYFRWKRWL